MIARSSTIRFPNPLLSRPVAFSTHVPRNPKPSLTSHCNSSFKNQRRFRNGVCRAELSHDMPLVFSIGACMLNSLVLPIAPASSEGHGGNSVMGGTDARFAVMGIISFIPYFNWLSWVFAWMDTGKRRYAVYSLVYLAPYFRSNFSLSPDESWLPIASIIFCIIHIQLEASITNGDLEGFQIFGEVAKHLSTIIKMKDGHSKGSQKIPSKERMEEHRNLPSAEEQLRKEIKQWGVSRESLKKTEQSNEDLDEEERTKH